MESEIHYKLKDLGFNESVVAYETRNIIVHG